MGPSKLTGTSSCSWGVLDCRRSATRQTEHKEYGLGMVKNKGKGGKNRRRGKNDTEGSKREITFKEDGQEYAQVTRMLGNGRLEAFCFDGVNRLCHIRGKLRKRVWIGVVSVPHATQLPCVPHPSG